jgi:Protein of unknown function (DUF2934)
MELNAMASKTRVNRPLGPAPRTVAEESILENIEQAPGYAEGVSEVDPQLRHAMIATAAYYLAEQRGFTPGHEREDWYRAQAAIDKELPRVLIRD